jgi:hypothetical protein
MPKKGTQKKSSLMGINLSRTKKADMAQVLPSNDLDGIAEYPRPCIPVLFFAASLSVSRILFILRFPSFSRVLTFSGTSAPKPQKM